MHRWLAAYSRGRRNGFPRYKPGKRELLGFLKFGCLPGLFSLSQRRNQWAQFHPVYRQCHYNRCNTRETLIIKAYLKESEWYIYWCKLLMYVTISSHTYAIHTMTKDFGALIDFIIDPKLSKPVLRFKSMDRVAILSDHLLKIFLKQIPIKVICTRCCLLFRK